MKKIDFSNKVALVTGGTKGIGKSIVNLLASLNCSVIYTGTKKEIAGDAAVVGCSYLQLDLNDKKSTANFLLRLKKFPRIDILINNAGINVIEPIDKITIENWDKILKVNLTGAMVLMREVSGLMMKKNIRGKILNIGSIFSFISKAKRASYSASKAGLIGLTRAAALDLAPYGILVNALCPGFTLTELTRNILSKNEIRLLSQEIPLGRFAEQEEIARIAAYLCSEANSYMTGQILIADGGFSVK